MISGMGLGGEKQALGEALGGDRRSAAPRRDRRVRRRRARLRGDERAVHRPVEGRRGASRHAEHDEICRDRAQQAPPRADHGRGRLATRSNGTASGRRAARRRATGCAPRPIRSRAGPAKSSSASSPSISSACREPDAMMTLTDDQRMLQDSVAPFMAEEGAIKTQLRHWRDIGCKDGFGHGLWKQFAELGLTGILIPEAQGGAGLGMVEAGVVLEEIGRNLTPSPFLTTAVAAVRALEGSRAGGALVPGHRRGRNGRRAGDRRGQASRPGADRAGGQAVRATASCSTAPSSSSSTARAPTSSSSRRAPPGRRARPGHHPVRGRARRERGWTIDNVALADSSEGGAADASTMSRSMPTRWSARSTAAGRPCRARSTPAAPAPRPSWSGSPPGASEMTFEYLKQRKQFGKLIGEFQALQHRAAHLYGEIEIARAAALKAAQLLDAGDRARRADRLGRQGQGARSPRSASRKACRCTAASA